MDLEVERFRFCSDSLVDLCALLFYLLETYRDLRDEEFLVPEHKALSIALLTRDLCLFKGNNPFAVDDDSQTLLHWVPRDLILLKQVENITLCSIQLSHMDGLQVDDKLQVRPNVVVFIDVEREAFLCLSVESLIVDIANEADTLDIQVSLLIDFSQLGKRVDNDTEDDIQ
jgi:hypothetical protein